MAPSVTWYWNSKEILINIGRFLGFQYLLGFNSPCVCAMNDAAAAEVFMEFLVVGNVVAMRKEHHRDAAEFLDTMNQRSRESWRIHQHVPFRPRN